MQRLRNRAQLVITGQATPGEGFATRAVHRVAYRAADVLFDRNQLGITRAGEKGGQT